MRRYAVPVIAVVAVVGAAACSPDEADFKDEAESFIEDTDGDIASQLSMTFTDAACEEPASTDEGSTFTCTATGSDGASYLFTAEVKGEREFEINDIEATEGGAPGATTGGPATSTPTT